MTETEYLHKMDSELRAAQAQVAQLQVAVDAASRRAHSVQQELDAIPGRRVAFALSGDLTFTIANNRLRMALTMEPSQDGPFVLTHYPVISWMPSAPATATNLGLFSSIRTSSLPLQMVQTDIDAIDISYDLTDSGAERGLQSAGMSISGQLISTGDNIIPMAMPTIFPSNTRITVGITFHNILFAAGAGVPTTSGTLHVDLLGYRIVSI